MHHMFIATMLPTIIGAAFFIAYNTGADILAKRHEATKEVFNNDKEIFCTTDNKTNEVVSAKRGWKITNDKLIKDDRFFFIEQCTD